VLHFQAETVLAAFWPSVAPVLIYQSEYCVMHNGWTGLIDDERSANGQGKTLMLLGQIVEPLVVRDNPLQGPIASICIRLAAMEAGDRPRRDTGVIDDWDDTIPHAFSHCAKVRSSAMINRWISSLVFGIFSTIRTMTDFHCADQSYACTGACTLAGFTVITEGIAGQTWTWRRLFHSPR
jgi:hypothetical protein